MFLSGRSDSAGVQPKSASIVNPRPFSSSLREGPQHWESQMADILKTKKSIPWFIPSVLELVSTQPDDINYDEIIIMTGWYVTSSHPDLASSYFFCRYMRPPLVEAGHAYIALPPLTRCPKGKVRRKLVEYAFGRMGVELEELLVENLVVELPSSVTRGLVRYADQLFGRQLWSGTRTLYPSNYWLS